MRHVHHWERWCRTVMSILLLSVGVHVSFAQCVLPGTAINFSSTGQTSTAGYTTRYVLTDANGIILSNFSTTSVAAPATAGNYAVYAVNYNTGTGYTAPNLAAGTAITAIGGTCVASTAAPITFAVCATSASPVATVGSQPTTARTSTGSISLNASTGSYPANAPVSVTYTSPSGSVVYSGTTDANGTITIPNLPAGSYGSFAVAVNGQAPSSPSGSVTLVDPAEVAPVVTVTSQPQAAGSSTASISLSASTGSYPASTPVSVTYTSPTGPVVFTGTTDATGKVTISNLPAGNYGPFTVAFNGGTPSTSGGSVTITDPVCVLPGASISFSNSGANTGSGYTTRFVLTSDSGYILSSTTSTTVTAPAATGSYRIYAVNYNSSNGYTAPTLTAGTSISAIGGSCVAISGAPLTFCVNGGCLAPGTVVSFANSGANTASGYTTQYALVNASGAIVSTTSATSVTAPNTAGDYLIYAVNYNSSNGYTAPTLTAGTAISAIGGTCASISSSPLGFSVCFIPAAPVATVGAEPSSVRTPTGSINLTASTGSYPVSSPVSVTYTTPTGTTAVYTGTTDATGKITIPNLPAGNYGPFTVAVNGGTPSTPGGSVTLSDPAEVAPVITGINPTSPGTSTGSVSLSASTGTYPASTPVSVTYTSQTGPVVYTGTTDANGKITIPNLPAGQYGPFTVSVNGGTPSTPTGSVTLVDPAASTPVASVGSNPTSAGTSTGSISLTGTTGAYPANTPVSVTYTSPTGPVVFTGTTDANGKITIPNLPAGQYGPFTVAVNGGTPSTPSTGTVSLVDPAPSTPVASVGSNPTTPGTSTGSISLNPVTGSYPANTPVSVTYTSPSGPVTFTGTTDANGKITIPNLPAGQYGPFTVSVNGSTPSAPSTGTVTLVDPAASTPVVSVGTNPTTPGTSTGSISLSASTGTYPANTPVSVTYTSPTGPVTFTGTTDANGKITIPNLPAGQYGPFTVSVNGGTPSTPTGSVTLVDPAPSVPVVSVTNPTSPGTSTGSISLTGTTGAYPANTPVSVTYTSPSGPVTFTGTTDATGKITIPNLPAGQYGPFTVAVNGGTPSTPSTGKVSLVDPAPVVTVTNPTTPGTSTGSISLSASTGTYPVNTPVSVTYTSPTGPVTFTGTTDATGKITIPNLPAGQYGPFTVSVNGGTPSTPSTGTVTLVDPAASTPVASVGTNPTSAGTSTGSISLTGTTGSYPASTPVSVTYTAPNGTTAVYAGTTDATGKITIPNLPAGRYGPFTVSVNGSTPSAPSTGTVTLVDPAPSTPIASIGTNPTTPGTSTGSISLTGTTGSYPASTPVSVTYTGPNGTTAVYTGTTDANGKITIPNLPAGQYGPFKVSINGGPASVPSTGTVTLVDPAPDLTPTITALPGTVHNTGTVTVAVDVVELNNLATSGTIKVYVSKDPRMSLSFNPSATSIGGQPVSNTDWSFDGSSNTSYYILTTSKVISGGGVLSFGLSGTLTPGATKGQVTISTVIVSGANETRLTNNTDADKINYFPQ